MDIKEAKRLLKRVWRFIWDDDSVWSWLLNVVMAFVLIKFIVYPVLGMLLGTGYPIVAVVSGSMEHDGAGFSNWWAANNRFYSEYGITEDRFYDFQFRDGFNTGDIMILYGKSPSKISVGEVVVFRSDRPDPIIHRVIRVWDEDGTYHFQTKGDHNADSIHDRSLNELDIHESQIIGKAMVRIPYLGWIKILFVRAVAWIIRVI